MELEKEIKQGKPFRNDYHRASVNLIFTGKWTIQFHSDTFKKYDLTPQQYNILRILQGRYPEPAMVKLIRERMLDRLSDASRIVEHLRKKDLVERNISGTDRRRMEVVITDKGANLLKEMEKENEQMDNHLSALNKEEIILLNNLLDKVRGGRDSVLQNEISKPVSILHQSGFVHQDSAMTEVRVLIDDGL